MRRGAVAKFVLGFRQGDVERALARRRAGHQELRGDRRLAGAGTALEQEQPAASQPADSDVVEALDTEIGFGFFWGHLFAPKCSQFYAEQGG